VTLSRFANNSAKATKSGRSFYSYNSAQNAMVIRLAKNIEAPVHGAKAEATASCHWGMLHVLQKEQETVL
jgi:hypothetical protein